MSPYIGGDISVLFGKEAQAATREATRKMVNEGGKMIEHFAKINTPVETGELRESWKRGPAVPIEDGFRSEVSTDVDYAPYVEHGTGLFGPKHSSYVIKPKNPGGTLRFMIGGRVVFAKFVIHPGSPGNHMMAIALNVTEAAAQQGSMFAVVLREWQAELEANGERQV